MTPPPTSIDGTDITGATIDGQEVIEITVDGDRVFRAEEDAIFSDDFRDNKLFSNRDSYDTLGYDGLTLPSDVIPVGRFPFDNKQGNATASNGQLVFGADDVIAQQVDFDLNRPMAWEFELDSSQQGTGGSRAFRVRLMLGANHNFTSTSDDAELDFIQSDTIGVFAFDDGTNDISETFSITRDIHDVKATYEPNGDFELFVDGVSVATFNTTIGFDPTFLGTHASSGDVGTIRIDSFVAYFND